MSSVPAVIAERRRRARLALIGAVLAAAWAGGLASFAGRVPERLEDANTRTDAIVVLTGGTGRLDAGLDLLDRGQAGKLFISGVYQGIDVQKLLQITRRESRTMESRITLGGAANTRGNARESAEWASREGVRSLRLVTGAYHMPRSLLEFRHHAPGVTIVAHPVFPDHVKADWWAWPGTLALIATEYNKTLLAWTRHRLRDAALWLGRGGFKAQGPGTEKPS